MKEIPKFIVVPAMLFDNPDLTIEEKWLLITIDRFCSLTDGMSGGSMALSTAAGIPVKRVKELLQTLYNKNAIEVSVSPEGQKFIKPLLYKQRYSLSDKPVTFGDKPKDATNLDYDEIMRVWNESNPKLAQLTRMTPRRKQKIRTLLKDNGASVDDLYKAFRIVAVTPFLTGQNDKNWCATADWIFERKDVLTKILEGVYSKTSFERSQYEKIMYENKLPTEQNDEDSYR